MRWLGLAVRNFLPFAVIAAVLGGPTGDAAATRPQSSNGAVVVMYHRFGEDRYPASNIRLDQFESHIRELSSGRYEVLPLKAIVEALAAGQSLPDRSIALTIDDAFLSVYQQAWPRLREAKLPFTLFVATASIGADGYMTWDQLRELVASGQADIGSQSENHHHMTELSPEQMKVELDRARTRIREELGVAAELFAYPYGEYSLALRDLVAASGYLAAFGQHSGAISRTMDRYELPRFALSENYGDEARFRLVANALPLSARDVTPRDSRLTAATNPPAYGFTVTQPVKNLDRIACYGAGLSLQVERLGQDRFEVRVPRAFKAGRSRINCTLPASGGRWRWLGRQFYVPGG